MKVQARANGNVVEIPDEIAQNLISAGIYDAVEDVKDDAPPVREPYAKRKVR